MFAVGLAVGVIIAVGGLFYIQVKTKIFNRTLGVQAKYMTTTSCVYYVIYGPAIVALVLLFFF